MSAFNSARAAATSPLAANACARNTRTPGRARCGGSRPAQQRERMLGVAGADRRLGFEQRAIFGRQRRALGGQQGLRVGKTPGIQQHACVQRDEGRVVGAQLAGSQQVVIGSFVVTERDADLCQQHAALGGIVTVDDELVELGLGLVVLLLRHELARVLQAFGRIGATAPVESSKVIEAMANPMVQRFHSVARRRPRTLPGACSVSDLSNERPGGRGCQPTHRGAGRDTIFRALARKNERQEWRRAARRVARDRWGTRACNAES